MKSIVKIIFLISSLVQLSSLFAQSNSILSEVSTDSIMLTLKELTGAIPITLNNKIYRIETRTILTTGNRIASEYISQKFKQRGLYVENSHFHGKYDNPQLNFTSVTITPGTKFPLWLCTDWGEVFSLENSNANWESRLNSGIPLTDRLDFIQALNKDTVVAIGRTGTLVVTTDAGETWLKKSVAIGQMLDFITSPTGILIAISYNGAIWRSSDFGTTWSRITIDDESTLLQGVFLSNNHVVVVGYDNVSPSLGRMFESKDGGKKWTIVVRNFKNQINTICSTDSMNAWCATSGGEVYLTDTGGDLWEKSVFDEGSSATQIFFNDELNGWIYSTYKEFFHTSDGGRTWKFLSHVESPKTVNDFLFYNKDDGLLVGNEVSKKQTSSGGSLWTDNTLPFLRNVIATIDGTKKPEQYILLTAHSDCTLNSSPTLWLQAPGADDDGSGIAVLLELARVFSKKPLPISLKFAAVPDEEMGFGKGSSNLGTTLLNQSNTCRLVFDFDMVGYDYLYPGSVTMSYYGGDTSAKLFSNYKNILASTHAPLNLFGWKDVTPSNTVGFVKKGIPILGLTEGQGYGSRIQPNYHGISDLWSTINPDYITDITRSAAAFIENIATDLLVGIAEEKNSNSFLPSLILEPPYPNPFNSSTIISFGLPKPAQVSLIVYNLLGQQVAQIAKGFYGEGYHTTSWDAANMNSGIYFVRLTSSDAFSNKIFSKTRKILLLK